ncbi:uncharacterized protein EV422DRAFT_484777, partial [Fimicolochytrium jonesii]|uniref:uncharacterized protein n=1 Tax=Fimicolochytrium jonesii TaxID=1396493 RepID=UPI0022FDE68E
CEYPVAGSRICGKTFSTTGHLSRHARGHTDDRPHACEFPDCDRKFTRADNLREVSSV